MKDFFWIQYYTLKYFAQGDTWKDARYLANYLVKGWKE